MLKTNPCTTGAPQSVVSLLSLPISSSTMQNASNIILPYSALLPTGSYSSKVLTVDEGLYKENPYLDCTHELTAPSGEVWRVKFRFFAPVETEALFKKLADYMLIGTVAEVLTGLEENITIAPRPGSTKYVFIASRTLVTSTVSSSQPLKKSSSFGKHSRLGNKANPSSRLSTRDALLVDDDAPEFADFLDEDEE